MKRGFLLGSTSSRSNVRSQTLSDGSANSSNLSETTVISHTSGDSMAGMKRGFLLNSSKKMHQKNTEHSECDHSNSKGSFPQCKLMDLEAHSPQFHNRISDRHSKRRIVSSSSALLDLEKNIQNEPSLLKCIRQGIIHDSEGEEKVNPVSSIEGRIDWIGDFKKNRNEAENEREEHICLDDWVKNSSIDSYPLALPSSPVSMSRRSKDEHNELNPLIVELEPLSSTNKTLTCNSKPDLLLPNKNNQKMLDKDSCSESNASKFPNNSKIKQNNGVVTNSIHFVNSLSLLLSRLHRCMKPKSQQQLYQQQEISDGSKSASINIGYFIPCDIELQVRAFFTKHFQDGVSKNEAKPFEQSIPNACNPSYGNESMIVDLWNVILGTIADDYTTHTSNVSKNTNKSHSCSSLSTPTIAVGLCILNDSVNAVAAHDSLVMFILSATNTVNYPRRISHEDYDEIKVYDVIQTDNRHCKILALGAVCLLRVWVRVIGVNLTDWEEQLHSNNYTNVSSNKSKDLYSGLAVIKSKVERLIAKELHALVKVVNSDTRRTVLISAAMDASYELIELSARITVALDVLHVSNVPSNNEVKNNEQLFASMNSWRVVLPIIKNLIFIRQGWITKNEDSKHRRVLEQRHESTNLQSSRSKCAIAVLDDWINVIKTSQRSFFDHFVANSSNNGDKKTMPHEEANITAGLSLIWNLAGFALRKSIACEGHTVFPQKQISRVGGIACLCQNQECTNSVTLGPNSDIGGHTELVDLIASLHEIAKLMEKTKVDKGKTIDLTTWAWEIQQRQVIRAFIAWLSKVCKSSRIFFKSIEKSNDNVAASVQLADDAISNLIVMLRLESRQCVEMIIAALSMLWAVSPSWRLEGMSCDNSTISPQPFLDILDALYLHSSQHNSENDSTQTKEESCIDSTVVALCIFASKIASQRPTLFLPFVLKFNGPKYIIIEVILNVLDQLPTDAQANSVDIAVQHNFVQNTAVDLLIKYIDSVPYLRLKIESNSLLFCHLSCEKIIPPIVEYLAEGYSNRSTSPALITLSILLRNIMIANLNHGHSFDFVKSVVNSLQKLEGSINIDSSTKKDICSSFLEKNGSLWRSTLLEKSEFPDFLYDSIMIATAKEMVEVPSSSIPLLLLASLVDTSETVSQTTLGKKRISIATSNILEFATRQISINRPASTHCDANIFTVLAPFLILRRIPYSYFKIVHEIVPSSQELKATLVNLRNLLLDFIQEHALQNDKSDVAKEEKRLIAEIAGHCLPFTTSHEPFDGKGDTFSLFDGICKKSFSKVLYFLRGATQVSIHDMTFIVMEAKTALYAVCHHIPLAYDEDDGVGLHYVTTFLFEVLQYEPKFCNEVKVSEEKKKLLEEVMTLQSGCIHCLALSFNSLSLRQTRNCESRIPSSFVEEIHQDQSNKVGKESHDFLTALSNMFNLVLASIIKGKIEKESLHPVFNEFPKAHELLKVESTIRVSPSSRIALINSFVMLAQNSRHQDNGLEWIAGWILPSLLEFARPGPIDDEIHNPLCIAAGFQVVYTLLARLGNFNWLTSVQEVGTKLLTPTDFISTTLECALNSFRIEDQTRPGISSLRLAALKLILSTLVLYQASSEAKSENDLIDHICLLKIRQAIAALCGAANVDQNPDVRRLASEVVPHLQHIVS